MKDMSLGGKKKHEFCVAFLNYAVGQQVVQHASLVIERNAKDILADTMLATVTGDMEALGCQLEVVRDNIDCAQAIKFQDFVLDACPKIAQAMQTWSPSRAEEQWEDVQEVIHAQVGLHRHGVALLTRNIVAACLPVMTVVDAHAEAWKNSSFSEEGYSTVRDELCKLWQVVEGTMVDIENLRGKVIDSGACLQTLLTRLKTVKCLSIDVVSAYAASVTEDLKVAFDWMGTLVLLVNGIEAMFGATTQTCWSYPDVLDSYGRWLELKKSEADDDAPGTLTLQQKLDRLRSAHVFQHLIKWSVANLLHDVGQHFSVELYSLVLVACPSVEQIAQFCQWPHSSWTSESLHEHLWGSNRKHLIDGLLVELGTKLVNNMDEQKASGAVDAEFLPLLANGDLKRMSCYIAQHFDFASNTVASNANVPSVRRSMLLVDVIKQTCSGESDLLDALQQISSDDCVAMTFDDCCLALQLHTQVHNTLLVAAAVHGELFIDPGNVITLVADPVSKSLAGEAATKDNMPQAAGLRLLPINMLQHLKVALGKLGEFLQDGKVNSLDSKGYKFEKSVSHLKMWHSQMQLFLKGCQSNYLEKAVSAVKQRAEDLESAIPRWDVVFIGETMDVALARTRVLNHPKKPQVSPLTKLVTKVFADLESHAASWGLQQCIDEATRNFVTATTKMASHFLIIVAGLNTVINHKSSPNASKQAQEVLDIGARAVEKNDFKFPETLATCLTELAQKVPEHSRTCALDDVASTGMSGSSKRSMAETPAVPPKRAKVSAPSVASTTASSSQASLNNSAASSGTAVSRDANVKQEKKEEDEDMSAGRVLAEPVGLGPKAPGSGKGRGSRGRGRASKSV